MAACPSLVGRAGALALLIALCSCAGSSKGGGASPSADLTGPKNKVEAKSKADAKGAAPAVDPAKSQQYYLIRLGQ